MKKLWATLAVVMTLATVSGCANGAKEFRASEEVLSSTASQDVVSQDKAVTSEKNYNPTLKFESQALQGNLANEKTEKEVYIYLPPSYYDSDKNYPVVYYLHGYSESSRFFVSSHKNKLDEAFKNGAKEFILVGVNGLTQLGGSFYTNSPVTGNWEDYVVEEVVSLVDENFRTQQDSHSRGICGFSMGGYGAYNIALKHPDVFGAMLTMSPGLIADNDLPLALETWKYDKAFQMAYAQAFSPNVDHTDTYGNIPELSGTPEDDAIVANWENGFGNINQKVDAYLVLNKPLKGIKIIYGEKDGYSWIPRGCKSLSTYLDEHEIDYSIESLPYGHIIHPQVIENYIVPFFNQNLSY